MNRLSLIFVFIAVFILLSCSAGKLAMKKGDKKTKYGEYDVSIGYYHKAINHKYDVAAANFKIGESYRLSNRIKEALPYYKAAMDGNYPDPSLPYYYGVSLKVNEKYDEAETELQNFVENSKDDEFIKLAKLELNNLDEVHQIIEKKSYFRVKNLDEINSENAEYAPVYLDGQLYFTSSRQADKIYKATGTGFTDIYKVKTQGARVDLSTLTPLSDLINSDNTNDGCITFSPDGQTMVYAKGNSGRRKGADDVDLYISRFRRGAWSAPELMRINDPKAWESTPAFSQDGQTLYFSSNRRGGYGGTDLYAATKNRRGRFSSVRNLGPVINTAGDEMFPFAGQDGNLYFSSNGHPGLGGLDILVAKRASGKMVVENLGPPINSSSDDFGIFLYSLDKGFFSSNRDGGKGDDDIYTFINNDPDLKIVNYFLVGTTVTNTKDSSEVPLPNTAVKLFGVNDELLNEALTGRDGKFYFRVYPEEKYTLVAEKPDYFTTRAIFSTEGKSIPKNQLNQLVTNKTFETRVQLDQIELNKSIVLENIYYDLDKWDIRPDAAVELDKLVSLLKDNPEIKIELSSHTDSRASAEYNDELSKKRAQAAVNYMVSKGIDPSRLIARGYGESRPIITDEQIAQMKTEEEKEAAHQKNRRTEFKVIEYNKVVEEQQDEETEDIGVLQTQEKIDTTKDGNDLENKIDWDN